MNKYILAIVLSILILILGYFVYTQFFSEEKVEILNNTTQEIDTNNVTVEEKTFEEDLSGNISNIETELEGLDIDKDLADFDDIKW